MSTLDHRLHAYKDGLADKRLQDRVEAPAFVDGTLKQVTIAVAPMYRRGSEEAAIDSEVLFGETLRVFEERDGWAWCQADVDDYVGYVPSSALSETIHVATHRVTALLTPLYPKAELRRPPVQRLSFGSRVAIVGTETVRDLDYVVLADGSAIAASHVLPIAESIKTDFVSVCERFIGLPYVWAGRSSLGVDCSGLLQLAMMMTGPCPLRDSDMQEMSIGSELDLSNGLPNLQRGDLIFWKGHVGVASDPDTVLHASGRTMTVLEDPLVEMVERLEGKGLPVTTVRRP